MPCDRVRARKKQPGTSPVGRLVPGRQPRHRAHGGDDTIETPQIREADARDAGEGCGELLVGEARPARVEPVQRREEAREGVVLDNDEQIQVTPRIGLCPCDGPEHGDRHDRRIRLQHLPELLLHAPDLGHGAPPPTADGRTPPAYAQLNASATDHLRHLLPSSWHNVGSTIAPMNTDRPLVGHATYKW